LIHQIDLSICGGKLGALLEGNHSIYSNICYKKKQDRLSRERVKEMSFGLFSGESIEMTPIAGVDRYYLEVIRKRTLVVNSLVGDSDTPEGVGKLRLIEVDASGFPKDMQT
jgi:hypothetical protein